MARRHNPRLARKHWVYSRKELRETFSVCDGTITNWIARGLKPIDDKRPQLFLGNSVRSFLFSLRKLSNRQSPDGRIFCNSCHSFAKFKVEGLFARPIEFLRVEVTGFCSRCDNKIQLICSGRQYDRILASASNKSRDTSVKPNGLVSERNGSCPRIVKPETNSSNLRRLYDYKLFLQEHEGQSPSTLDEHLRSLAKISGAAGYRTFESYGVDDVLSIKELLRASLSEDGAGPSQAAIGTVLRTLNAGCFFFSWLGRQERARIPVDLPGYFDLSKAEKRRAQQRIKHTNIKWEQLYGLFRQMPNSTLVERRDRAIVALLLTTGIRVGALITLRGRHLVVETGWVYQMPPEVSTKHDTKIFTYILPLAPSLIAAISGWSQIRNEMGFGDEDAFFPPNRYLESNAIGLGRRMPGAEHVYCWKSGDPVETVIKRAAENAGLPSDAVSAHVFRKAIHPYLSQNGNVLVRHEVALQLNLGHKPDGTIRKHYGQMDLAEQQVVLEELCRSVRGRSDATYVLMFERGEIDPSDPDFEYAKALHLKAAHGSFSRN